MDYMRYIYSAGPQCGVIATRSKKSFIHLTIGHGDFQSQGARGLLKKDL